MSFNIYRRKTANIIEHAIKLLVTCACLAEFDFFDCVLPGVCVVDSLFPVLVTIPNEVVAGLKLDAAAVGSTKPQVGVAGPAVALAHTPTTH
jgi:hypothetical protein